MNKFNLKIKLAVIFLSIVIFCIINVLVISKKAMPLLMSYANVRAKKIGVEILRSVGLKEINERIKKEKLYTINKNSNSEIESIDFNTPVLNDTLMIVAKTVRKKLKQAENNTNNFVRDPLSKKTKNGIIYEVPLGIVLNNNIFSSFGPKIPVKIEYVGNATLDVKSRVKDYGVNSALVEVYIYIEVTQRTILPFQSKDVKLTSEVPIVMEIVKGSSQNYITPNKKSYSLPIN